MDGTETAITIWGCIPLLILEACFRGGREMYQWRIQKGGGRGPTPRPGMIN